MKKLLSSDGRSNVFPLCSTILSTKYNLQRLFYELNHMERQRCGFLKNVSDLLLCKMFVLCTLNDLLNNV